MGHIIMSAAADQGPLLNRVSMAQYSIAVVFVLLRFFTRGFIVKKFGLDDLFIFIAITLGLGQTATIVLQVEHGRGRHTSELDEENFNLMLKYKWINMLIYFVANWAVKMSILALYNRIGSGKRGLPLIVQSRAIWITAGFISAFTLAVIFVQVFSCIPVTAAWDVEQIPIVCIDGATFMHAQGGINVFTDVVLLLYPLPLLRLLKFNKRQRTALIVIFSIGLIPVVASTMRLCEIVMSGHAVQSGMSWQQADSSWTWAWVPVWSQIEVDIGILTACLPCLSPLLRLFWTEVRAPRNMTPSMVELPKYSGSFPDSVGSQEGKDEKACEALGLGKKGDRLNVGEKELPALPKGVKREGADYYDDASDEEEGQGVGLARTSSKRVEYGLVKL
ncbi:L-fucose permease [Stagonosporopsis vannaccii]|nr:L-fucose permease [Stagonosporopsis vannaccii]